MEGPPRVGVLFVHGIGAQPRGRTLDECAGPLVDWLIGWYGGLHRGWVEAGLRFEDLEGWLARREPADPRWLDGLRPLLDVAPARTPDEGAGDLEAMAVESGSALSVAVRVSESTGRQDRGDAPPHARLDVTHVHVDGATTRTTWLLAESWWAEAFAPPTFGDLARWGLGVLPRTIGSHLGARVHRAWRSWQERRGPIETMVLLGRLGALVLGLFASLGALAVLAVVLLVGLLPIPRLRQMLRTLQQRLASSLGDSYVLVARPVQAAAVVGQVRRDLAWLCATCENVAVVAHSQGGAVVNEVLRQELDASSDLGGEDRSGRLGLLVTFGSGLRKLDELRRLLGPGGTLRRSAVLTLLGLVLFTFAVLALVVVVTQPHWRGLEDVGLLVVYGVIGGALLTAGLADLVADRPGAELESWVGRFRRTGVRWIDYAANADPVPNGPLLADDQPFPEHVTLHNRGSLLRDHTTYWTNSDQFVGDLVVRLAELDPLIAADFAGHEGEFALARRRRQWRVGWLVGSRWVAMASGAVALARGYDQWMPSLGDAVRWAARLAGLDVPAAAVDHDEAAAALAPAAAVMAAYVVAAMAWRALDRAEAARLPARRPPDFRGAGTAYVFSVVVLLLVSGWAVAPVPLMRLPEGVRVGAALVVFLAVVTLWFASQLRWGVFVSDETAVVVGPQARAERVWRVILRLVVLTSQVVGLVVAAAALWGWLRREAALAVIVGVLAALIGLVQVRRWRRRQQ